MKQIRSSIKCGCVAGRYIIWIILVGFMYVKSRVGNLSVSRESAVM